MGNQSADYAAGYTQGVADLSARLVGVVANHLGTTDPDDPLIRRMVEVIGQVADAAPK